jgi:serine/threonine protein kinase
MTEQRNRRVAELFEAALREEPAHRSEFLRRACADDESLLIEVRSLVDEDERLGHTTGASLQETASMTSHANFDASGISHIARYLVVRELGRGGMGVVFEARDPLIGRTVAIKTIRLDAFAGFSDTRSLQDLLLREARTAGALSHPGIVIIHDCGVYDNLTFITMEYIDGPTLQRKLRMERQIERSEAVNLLRQIAVALDYAHAAGVVHRDVKPGNIMLQQGRLVKITDFGIAKVSVTHQLEHTSLHGSRADSGASCWWADRSVFAGCCRLRNADGSQAVPRKIFAGIGASGRLWRAAISAGGKPRPAAVG